jgi:hypothetical protein
LAEIHFPKVMTCAFGAAAHSFQTMHKQDERPKNSALRLDHAEDWHGRGPAAMTLEHRKCSVSFLGSE